MFQVKKGILHQILHLLPYSHFFLSLRALCEPFRKHKPRKNTRKIFFPFPCEIDKRCNLCSIAMLTRVIRPRSRTVLPEPYRRELPTCICDHGAYVHAYLKHAGTREKQEHEMNMPTGSHTLPRDQKKKKRKKAITFIKMLHLRINLRQTKWASSSSLPSLDQSCVGKSLLHGWQWHCFPRYTRVMTRDKAYIYTHKSWLRVNPSH